MTTEESELLDPAAKTEITQQIRRAMSLSDEYFECRSLGHTWQQVEPFVTVQFGEPECFHCTRCGMFRVWAVSRRYGELLYSRYIQPPGYRVPQPDDGTRSFSASAFRVARLRRAKERELPSITPPEWGS